MSALQAEAAKDHLVRTGGLDGGRKFTRLGSEVEIPVTGEAAARDAAARFGGAVVEQQGPGERYRPRDPLQELEALSAGVLPPEARALLPRKWEKVGDVVVLRLPPGLEPHATVVGRLYAEALDAKTVLQDAGGIAGELREMGEVRFLHGSDPVTTHVEHGIRYRFDASRIMFSSGNVEERRRMGEVDASGETVIDMFAGIGYFTLPLAKRGGPRVVHALELNPLSFRHLQENARLNGVEDVVRPWHGDNRDFPEEGIADRVLMGYFPGTDRFLPKAMRLLKPEGGIVHYHDTVPEPLSRTEPLRAVLQAAARDGRAARLLAQRIVKSHSPGVLHIVADVALGPREQG